MKCHVHTNSEAVGTCVSCHQPICDECAVDVQGRLLGRECLAAGEVGLLSSSEITENDKMMGLLAYVVGLIIPLVILLSESGKTRPFQRYHAIHSLVLSGALFTVLLFFSCTCGLVLALFTAGLATICFIPLALIPYGLSIYYGVQAYQGEYAEIPFLTDFIRAQGWV